MAGQVNPPVSCSYHGVKGQFAGLFGDICHSEVEEVIAIPCLNAESSAEAEGFIGVFTAF